MTAWVDHGQEGTGEALAVQLRPGNAGSNTAADHITVTRHALAQLPGHRAGRRPGRRVLIRTDGAGGTHAFLDWLTKQRLSYSIGFPLPDDIAERLTLIPERVWAPAYDGDGDVRDGAWVAEVTDLLDLRSGSNPRPTGMRVIIRKERPHPGAQLRLTDVDGLRLTAFTTNTTRGQLADLELRHRRRARVEDRIRTAKDTGLRNLPLHGYTQNQIWCEIVALAADLLAWTQLLGCTDPTDVTAHPARRWEPKRLRLRVLSTAARLAVAARPTVLHLAAGHPWTGLVLAILTRLRALPAPSG